MYEDDRFNPVIKNDIDETSSIDVKKNKNNGKNVLNKFKSLDKGYRKLNVSYNNTWKDTYYGVINIDVYLSGDAGSRIRNAVTGLRSSYIVGTAEGEDQFFKAAIATGNEFNEKITLFYDSPEQFENHHMQFLDEPIKEAWRKRVGIM